MSDAVHIRRMTRSDYPQLVELVSQTWYADDDADGQETPDAVQDRGVASRLAAIDAQGGLARATHAAVAERDGRIIGVILASDSARVTRTQRTRHRLRQVRLALPLLASPAGRGGLMEQLAILQADRALVRASGKTYPAESVLFLVAPESKGLGVGGRLFAHMLGTFREHGVNEYFLFTDTSCDYGFYEHKGLRRMAVEHIDSAHGEALDCFLYEGTVE